MRRLAALCPFILLLASCGVSNTPVDLYYWGGSSNGTSVYEDLSYRTYKQQTPEVVCRLVCAYENMVSHPGGARNVPPPGICAEYAYLLLQENTAAYFAENATDAQRNIFDSTDYPELFRGKAEQLFAKEMEYYPESQVFIIPLIKKFLNRQP